MSKPQVLGRIRIHYGVEMPLCYLSVLDMGRLWARLLRRADIPLAYTQGFNPHPRLQFAAPLPVGYCSDAESLDVYLQYPIEPPEARQKLLAQAPQGLIIKQVHSVPIKDPAPQTVVWAADYRVEIAGDGSPEYISRAMERVLRADSLIRQRRKKGRQTAYDLRPLIISLTYDKLTSEGHTISMRLRTGPGGSGRPEEVMAELQIPADEYTIRRTLLLWGKREGA